jgi:site-specific DNA-methyltransferase (adenine-specific)
MIKIIHGDCLLEMAKLEANSVDAVVCDPPYGLFFMGKNWDHGIPGIHFWQEALRVAKPGAHLLAFGGTRTSHRLACAIEDAGWEIRDCIMWVYGSGFPKSLNIGKAVDQLQGTKRKSVGIVTGMGKQNPEWNGTAKGRKENSFKSQYEATKGNSPWEGYGTALKPSHEPIILARKPLEGTVAQNVLKWGTGGINIDGCRIEANDSQLAEKYASIKNNNTPRENKIYGKDGTPRSEGNVEPHSLGRFPSNFIHDGSEQVVELFPESNTKRNEKPSNCKVEGVISFDSMRGNRPARGYNGTGSAARFFYCAKSSKQDREEGCEDLPDQVLAMSGGAAAAARGEEYDNGDSGMNQTKIRKNNHPTVKPLELMKYLCRLITPPHGIILDPFMGSGSTGKAALQEGFSFIGIELEAEYVKIAKARIAHEIEKLRYVDLKLK